MSGYSRGSLRDQLRRIEFQEQDRGSDQHTKSHHAIALNETPGRIRDSPRVILPFQANNSLPLLPKEQILTSKQCRIADPRTKESSRRR